VAELWPGGPLTLPHTIVHDGVKLTIPELPVIDLFYWLSNAQWWQLYPNALSGEATKPIRARLFNADDPLDLVHLHDVATRLFELPEHLRQAEASAFLAALGESLPGEQMTAGIF
jgi:hypothetical protein